MCSSHVLDVSLWTWSLRLLKQHRQVPSRGEGADFQLNQAWGTILRGKTCKRKPFIVWRNICGGAFLCVHCICTKVWLSLSLDLTATIFHAQHCCPPPTICWIEHRRHNLYEILSPLLGHILPSVLTQLNNRPTHIPWCSSLRLLDPPLTSEVA